MDLTESLVVNFLAYDFLSGVADKVATAFESAVTRMKAGAEGISGGMMAAGEAMVKTGALMVGAGAVMVTGFVQAARAAADYESQLVLLHTHAGMSISDINQTRDALIALAPAVGYGPTALANAFYLVQSATTSLPPKLQDIASKEDILAQSAKLAQIGHADLSDTTNALVDVLDVYGKANYTAASAAAILNATVGEGKMRLQDLASAFSSGLLPVAQDAGIKLESLGAAIGTMTDAGIPATRAATYLRSAIIQMTEPSNKATGAIEALGIATNDAMTMAQGFSQVLEDAGINQTEVAQKLQSTGSLGQTLDWLKGKLLDAGLTGEHASALLATAFGGIRSGTGIQALMNNLDALNNKERDLTKATGDWNQTWDYFKANDPNFALQQIQATFKALDVALGEAFLPMFRAVLAQLAPMVMGLLSWVSAHRQLVATILEAAAAFLLIQGFMMIFGGAISFLTGGLFNFLGILGGAGKGLAALVGPLGSVAAKGGELGRALAAPIRYLGEFGAEALRLIPGFSGVERAIGGLLGRLGGIVGFANDVRKAFGFESVLFMAQEALGKLGGTVVGALRSLPGLALGALRDFGSTVLGVLRELPGQALAILRGLPGQIVGVLKSLPGLIMDGLRGAAVAMRAGLVALATDAIPALAGAIGAALPVIGIVIGVLAAVAVVAVLVKDHWGQINNAVHTTTSAFQAAIGVFMKTRDAGATLAIFLERLGVTGGHLKDVMDGVHRAFSLIGTILHAAQVQFVALWNQLVNGINHVHGLNQALASLQRAWTQIAPVVAAVGIVLGIIAGIILSLLGGAFKGLLMALGVAIPAAVQIAVDVIRIIGGVIQVAGALITGVVRVVSDILHGNWRQAWLDAQATVKAVAQGVGDILGGMWDLVRDIFTGGINTVKALVEGFVSGTIGAAQNLYHAIVGGSIIPDMVNGIVNWISQIGPRTLGVLEGWASGMAQKAQDGANRVTSAISNLAGNIAGTAESVGRSIASGIANGIWAGLQWVVNAAEGIASRALNAAKSALGISSPSKIMADFVGLPVAQGIAQGITQGEDLPRTAVRQVLEGTVKSAVSGSSQSMAPLAVGGGGPDNGAAVGPQTPLSIVIHTHTYIDGQEIDEKVEQITDARLSALLNSV